MNSKENKALYYVNSQPPNVAEVLGLLSVLDNFNNVILAVNGYERVISLDSVKYIWDRIIANLKNSDKVKLIVAWDKDWFSLTTMPPAYQDRTVCTLDRRIYTHLASLGISSKLVTRVQGYHDLFSLVAYRQGLAYDYLQKNY